MILDYNIDYDACFDEFTGDKVLEICKGHRWITAHTKKCSDFIYEKFGLVMQINNPVRFTYESSEELYAALKDKKLSGLFGGFHYKNIEYK